MTQTTTTAPTAPEASEAEKKCAAEDFALFSEMDALPLNDESEKNTLKTLRKSVKEEETGSELECHFVELPKDVEQKKILLQKSFEGSEKAELQKSLNTIFMGSAITLLEQFEACESSKKADFWTYAKQAPLSAMVSAEKNVSEKAKDALFTAQMAMGANFEAGSIGEIVKNSWGDFVGKVETAEKLGGEMEKNFSSQDIAETTGYGAGVLGGAIGGGALASKIFGFTPMGRGISLVGSAVGSVAGANFGKAVGEGATTDKPFLQAIGDTFKSLGNGMKNGVESVKKTWQSYSPEDKKNLGMGVGAVGLGLLAVWMMSKDDEGKPNEKKSWFSMKNILGLGLVAGAVGFFGKDLIKGLNNGIGNAVDGMVEGGKQSIFEGAKNAIPDWVPENVKDFLVGKDFSDLLTRFGIVGGTAAFFALIKTSPFKFFSILKWVPAPIKLAILGGLGIVWGGDKIAEFFSDAHFPTSVEEFSALAQKTPEILKATSENLVKEMENVGEVVGEGMEELELLWKKNSLPSFFASDLGKFLAMAGLGVTAIYAGKSLLSLLLSGKKSVSARKSFFKGALSILPSPKFALLLGTLFFGFATVSEAHAEGDEAISFPDMPPEAKTKWEEAKGWIEKTFPYFVSKDQKIPLEKKEEWDNNIFNLKSFLSTCKAKDADTNSLKKEPYSVWVLQLEKALFDADADMIDPRNFPVTIDTSRIFFLFQKISAVAFEGEENPLKIEGTEGNYSFSFGNQKIENLLHSPEVHENAESISNFWGSVIVPFKEQFSELFKSMPLLQTEEVSNLQKSMETEEAFTNTILQNISKSYTENKEIPETMMFASGAIVGPIALYKLGIKPFIKLLFGIFHPTSVLAKVASAATLAGGAGLTAFSLLDGKDNTLGDFQAVKNVGSFLADSGDILSNFFMEEAHAADSPETMEVLQATMNEAIPPDTRKFWNIPLTFQLKKEDIATNLSSLDALKKEIALQKKTNDSTQLTELLAKYQNGWSAGEKPEFFPLEERDWGRIVVLAQRLHFPVSVEDGKFEGEYILSLNGKKISLPFNPLGSVLTKRDIEHSFAESLKEAISIMERRTSYVSVAERKTPKGKAKDALHFQVQTLYRTVYQMETTSVVDGKVQESPLFSQSLNNQIAGASSVFMLALQDYNNNCTEESEKIFIEQENGFWVLKYDGDEKSVFFPSGESSIENLRKELQEKENSFQKLGENAYEGHKKFVTQLLDKYNTRTGGNAEEIRNICLDFLAKGSDGFETLDLLLLMQAVGKEGGVFEMIAEGVWNLSLEGANYTWSGVDLFGEGLKEGNMGNILTGGGTVIGGVIGGGVSIFIGTKIVNGVISFPEAVYTNLPSLKAMKYRSLNGLIRTGKFLSSKTLINKISGGRVHNWLENKRERNLRTIRGIIESRSQKWNRMIYGSTPSTTPFLGQGDVINQRIERIEELETEKRVLNAKNPHDIEINKIEDKINAEKKLLEQDKTLLKGIHNLSEKFNVKASALIPGFEKFAKVAGPATALFYLWEFQRAENPNQAAMNIVGALTVVYGATAVAGPIGSIIAGIGLVIWGEEFHEAMNWAEAKLASGAEWAGISKEYYQVGKSAQETMSHSSGERAWDTTVGEWWKGENAFAYFSETTPESTNFLTGNIPGFSAIQRQMDVLKGEAVFRGADKIEEWNVHVAEKVEEATSHIQELDQKFQSFSEEEKTKAEADFVKYQKATPEEKADIREDATANIFGLEWSGDDALGTRILLEEAKEMKKYLELQKINDQWKIDQLRTLYQTFLAVQEEEQNPEKNKSVQYYRNLESLFLQTETFKNMGVWDHFFVDSTFASEANFPKEILPEIKGNIEKTINTHLQNLASLPQNLQSRLLHLQRFFPKSEPPTPRAGQF